MLRKILKTISSKARYKKKYVWLKIPANLTSKADRDKCMDATMDMLEEIIYKNNNYESRRKITRYLRKKSSKRQF